MPKIKITEKDNTGNLQLNPITNVVYVPGAASAKTKPLFCGGVSELDGFKASEGLEDDLSFKLARRLLQLGMQVVYQGFVATEGMLGMTSDDWMALSDKALYDIRFLTTGAYAENASDDMVKCATKRGDCVALIDHDKDLNDDTVANIRAYFEDFVGDDDEASEMKGKFAAGFTPWFKSESDAFGGTKVSPVEIPASFGYLLAYARSIQSNPDWFAIAGTFRGNIPELSDVCREFTSAEVEILQARADDGEVALDESGDNIGFAINPIAYVRGYGYLVWGNRTLIENEDSDGDGSGDLKASAFLNVRNICIDIVKTLYAAARKYTFEQNSDVLWLNFRHEVQPLLDRMVSGNGIEAYTIERLATPKRARLKARIAIVPIEGVEDFELELYLEDSLEVIE